MTKHQTGTREEWLATMIRGMGDLRGPSGSAATADGNEG